MRELVIVVPDLYLGELPKGAPHAAPNAATLPGIEHVARFGSHSRLDSGWRPWLATWLGRSDLARAAPASVAAAAAVGVAAAPGVAGAPWAAHTAVANAVWLATPLHLQAGLTTLFVDRGSLLRLSPGELQELCADFGRVFGETGLHLEPLASGDALLFSAPTPGVRTVEPARFVDGDVAGALPTGSGASYLRRLGAEIEMWLHEHPVNQARVARRDLPVSTLWLWGNEAAPTRAAQEPGGVAQAPDVAQAHEVEAFGTDAYLQGLCRLQGIECRPMPDSLAVASRSAVIVVSVGELWRERGTFLDALNEVDRRFIEPAGRAVRTRVYRQVSLLANDRLIVLTERDHLRLWRRSRPGLEALRWT